MLGVESTFFVSRNFLNVPLKVHQIRPRVPQPLKRFHYGMIQELQLEPFNEGP